MQIAIITQVLKREDGQGRVNFELAHDLIRHGNSLILIATDVDQSLAEHDSVRWVPVSRSRLPTFLIRDQVFALRSTLALRRVRGGVDLVVVNGFVTWLKSDVNLVHFVHAAWIKSPSHPARSGFGVEKAYRWLYSILSTRLERFSFRHAEVIVAVSHLVRRQLIEAGVPAAKIEIVANGVDLSVFKPGVADRSDFGLPENVFITLFAGDLRSSRKNLETVLQAMVQMPNVVLAVAGDASRSQYPDMARSLRVADRVYFLGLISDISRLMRTVDAFVFPSRFEPFGLVVLEASASGLPVITSPCVGACDVLAPAGMILLDFPDDVGGIVRALMTLSTDATLRLRMGHAGHHAAQQLSWNRVMGSYRHIITNLVQQRQIGL